LKDRKVKGKIESGCSVALKKQNDESFKDFIDIAKMVPMNFLFAIKVAKSSSFCFQSLLKATS